MKATNSAKSTRLSLMVMTMTCFFSMFALGILLFTNDWGKQAEQEAYIAVFYSEDLNEHLKNTLESDIKKLEGIINVTSISKEEAMIQMKGQLGEASDILSLYEKNPFLPYFKLYVNSQQRNTILESINQLKYVEDIQDNEEILLSIQRISKVVTAVSFIFLLIMLTVNALIVYFIVHEMVKKNALDIETYVLMGAMPMYVYKPYLKYTQIFLLKGLIASSVLQVLFHFIINSKIKSEGVVLSINELNYRGLIALVIISVFVWVLGVIASYFAYIKEYRKHL